MKVGVHQGSMLLPLVFANITENVSNGLMSEDVLCR